MSRKRAERPRKRRYRVTNWREYNAALVARGSVTLWIDEAVISEWHKVSGKGAVYSDGAILCALSLWVVYGLTLRQTQGFLASLAGLLGLSIRIPDYSTLSRRAAKLRIPALPRLRPGAPVHLAIDSTGLKVFGEGEWKVRTHGKEKRRVWRKLHLGVDVETGEIHAHEVTESGRHDGPVLPELLGQALGPLEAVYADGAYDSFNCHAAVLAREARPVIVPRKGACATPPHGTKDPPPSRGEIVRRIRVLGRKGWKRESGYHRRSLSETAMFRYKTIIGPALRARNLSNQKAEVAIAIRTLNRFTALGMPISAPVT